VNEVGCRIDNVVFNIVVVIPMVARLSMEEELLSRGLVFARP
jgi:hypothetical protein